MSWSMHRRVESQEIRLHEMADRLDVSLLTLARMRQGDAYAEAREQCLFCCEADRCRRWFEDPAQAHTRPDFCPNLPILEACKKISATS